MEGIALPRAQARRLREIYRSSGWPQQDALEVQLLAAGLLARERSALGHELLRVTDTGLQALAASLTRNQAAFDAHEALVATTAEHMQRGGRIAFTGLSLRVQVAAQEDAAKPRWVIAKPDVFSIFPSSKEAFVAPAVHEIKVKRADVLGELKKPDKRAAYLGLCSHAWFVLGRDAKGREIADASELPLEFGVLQQAASSHRLELVRPAPQRAHTVPYAVWLALARATPRAKPETAQQSL